LAFEKIPISPSKNIENTKLSKLLYTHTKILTTSSSLGIKPAFSTSRLNYYN